MAKVGIVMGSDSDMPIMSKAAAILDKLGIDYEMKIISAHSADRILLGSDMPWSTAENEAKLIMSLDLPEDTTEKILCNNAKRLLHI